MKHFFHCYKNFTVKNWKLRNSTNAIYFKYFFYIYSAQYEKLKRIKFSKNCDQSLRWYWEIPQQIFQGWSQWLTLIFPFFSRVRRLFSFTNSFILVIRLRLCLIIIIMNCRWRFIVFTLFKILYDFKKVNSS